MDRSLEVRTPESIAFTYRLAGLGSRFLAVAADAFLQILLAAALLWALLAVANRFGAHAHELSRLANNVLLAATIFALFMILFGYFILFEAYWHGQTPGKRMLGIRVVRDGGYPLDITASVIRNLIRIVEAGVGFYALSAASTLLSPENKRVGDYAAGTIVVRDAAVAMPESSLDAFGEQPEYAATGLLDGNERELVHRFVERRDSLAPRHRAQIAAQLAARVRPRVDAALARLDDESLLERL